MLRNRLYFVLPLLLLILGGCASKLRTEVITSPLHDVTSKKTWSWQTESPIQLMGVLVGIPTDPLRVAMQSEARPMLESLGYRYVERNQDPDLIVTFMVGVSDISGSSVQQTQRERLDYRPIFTWTQTNEFLQGGAAVLLKDPADDEIVWQGAAIDKLDEASVRRIGEDTVRRLVRITLLMLPPAAPSS